MESDWESHPGCGCGESSPSALLMEARDSWSDGETGIVLVSALSEEN